MALGPVVRDLLFGLAHDAAYPAGVRGIHGAVALAAYDGTQRGLARNTAGALFFGLNSPPVLALIHQGPGQEGEIQRERPPSWKTTGPSSPWKTPGSIPVPSAAS